MRRAAGSPPRPQRRCRSRSAAPWTRLCCSSRVGFLPPEDPRVRGTVEAVRKELCEDGFVLRYRTDADPHAESGTVDGLPGSEGAFLACSFWLADALTLIGREDEARELFERLLDLRNDVGLLSEEWDTQAHRQLG